MQNLSSDTQTLAALALALVNNPRANLQELAKSIGISKATLYRFCRTREELIERLGHHSIEMLNQTFISIDLSQPSHAKLEELTARFLAQSEINAFLTYYWNDVAKTVEGHLAEWEQALDGFFFKGQQKGVFRLDTSAATLSEAWVSLLVGLIDSERRGRVARLGLSGLISRLFFEGAGTKA